MKATFNEKPNLEGNVEDLCSLYFRMSRIDGTYGVEPIKLLKNGSIYGHSNPNEYSWTFIDGNLAFLSKDGRVSTIFDNYSLVDDKLVLTGGFFIKTSSSNYAQASTNRFFVGKQIKI